MSTILVLGALTVNDFSDLLEILRTKLERKEALRRELLGEEILSLHGLICDPAKAVEEMNGSSFNNTCVAYGAADGLCVPGIQSR